jgi:hypothetical protein
MSAKEQKVVHVQGHINDGHAVSPYIQHRNVNFQGHTSQGSKPKVSAQDLVNDTVDSRPSLMSLGGVALSHVLRSDPPQILADEALKAVTCDTRHRATVKKLLVEVCEIKYGVCVFRAVARNSPFDGVSVVWTEVDSRADPETAAKLNARLQEEANTKIKKAI